jgi:hypothetical protein
VLCASVSMLGGPGGNEFNNIIYYSARSRWTKYQQ